MKTKIGMSLLMAFLLVGIPSVFATDANGNWDDTLTCDDGTLFHVDHVGFSTVGLDEKMAQYGLQRDLRYKGLYRRSYGWNIFSHLFEGCEEAE